MALLHTLDLRGTDLSRSQLQRTLPRPEVDVHRALEKVQSIIDDVQERGAEAILEYGEQFDGVRPPQLRVPDSVRRAALDGLDPQIRAALEVAIERVRAVDEAQLRDTDLVEVIPGGRVAQRWVPVERVGLYVPGGRAVLPSSVVMNAVPAQVAGVSELVVASPPQKEADGYPHPTILAACELLGITEVYAAGGAQAIAMFAFGDGVGLEPVDLVTGPGNVFVAAAKRAVRGYVGIDAEAGPTEIGIVADASAKARSVAADLISQAEHDPMAASVLITDSPDLIDSVRAELDRQVPQARHAERITEALRGPQSAAVLVDDIDAAVAVANAYGAEHLEIHTERAREAASRITNAGAVFVGEYSPVSLGDYAAGSNHVLPTGGSSRFSSGLGVHTFLRAIHEITYTREALAASREAAETLAQAEDLPAHGRAIAIRFED
ncbi:histidinol dehydrogenase [Helcobacillus sp. ACRRO]|uniref:histidinol dehydrogenase n=1 Tax=Helcobacillus TaxID=1161125 RepID=UPI001EF4E77C|nr:MULTISPECIES: histidinol dehydrogenase [Helcobacillus]MCG7427116.1 histidinol dehydrogenase [Helcobacillus sp. ACRRO]MDK7742514.1 histidinol dehydrogenase [Helcobacillus massiliensis]WOO93371.1 histidinol dehydrogenase [Helcobacillus massiliensis]